MEIEAILGFGAVLLLFLLLHIRLVLISKLMEIQLETAKHQSEQFQKMCQELVELIRILETGEEVPGNGLSLGEVDVPF